MKKNLLKLIFVLSCVVFISTQASSQSYTAGENYIHIGVGFPSFISTGLSAGINGGTESKMPPISAVFEHAINSQFSVGGMIGYTSYKYTHSYTGYGTYNYYTGLYSGGGTYENTYKWSYIIIAARGSYHFAIASMPKFDTYVGAALGYEIASSSFTSSDPNYNLYGGGSIASGSAMFFAGHIGTNYYFSNKFGAFAELGYGLALINIGVNFKL